MWPVLFTLGSVAIGTSGIFMMLAVSVASFIFWKRATEEHYEESRLFDGFLLSFLGLFVVARLSYIFLNFAEFGFQPIEWLQIIRQPGFIINIGVLMAFLIIFKFAIVNKWDEFEVLDIFAPSLATFLSIVYLGEFFRFGSWSALGVVPLVLFVLFLILSRYLLYVEYKYRTYDWYKGNLKSANTGFVGFLGAIIFSLVMIPASFFLPAQILILGFSFDWVFYLMIGLLATTFLFLRSGIRS